MNPAGRHNKKRNVPILRASELKVLKLYFFPLEEIAKRLNLSICTITTHVHNINSKLCAQSKTQAVIIALKRGLITIEDLKMENKNEIHS
jgi:DNA-binding NarL/FixJ family response regulator